MELEFAPGVMGGGVPQVPTDQECRIKGTVLY